MKPDDLEGILPVLYAFFDERGGLRLDGFRQQVDHCMENGAGGVILFGFVTQFYRLSFAEKVSAIRDTVRGLNGAGSLGVTVIEANTDSQLELCRVAREEGADWLILQPPLGPPARSSDWISMLRQIIDSAGLPVAVQNALIAGTHLTNDELVALQDASPNLVAVKAETASEDIAAFAKEFGHRFRVLTGNWGVEYPFFLRNGAHGLIPAPNFVPEQVALHQAALNGDWETVDGIHADILPLMQFFRERPAPEGQILLGKQAYGWRTGFDPGGNRAPGPSSCNPRIVEHARRLFERLPKGRAAT